jgi:hypothetical protein
VREGEVSREGRNANTRWCVEELVKLHWEMQPLVGPLSPSGEEGDGKGELEEEEYIYLLIF